MMSNSGDFLIKNGTLYKYEGDEKEVIIPSYVRRIAPEAFRDCKSIEKVAAPLRLVRIGNRAFYGCDSLKEVIIPGALFKRVKVNKIFTDPQNIYFRFYASSGLEAEFDEEFGAEWDDAADESYAKPVLSDHGAKLPVREEEQASASVEVKVVPQADVSRGKITGATTMLVDVSESEEQVADSEPEKSEEDVNVALLPDDITELEDDRTLRQRIEAVTPAEVPPEEISPARRRELLNLTDFLIEDTTLVKYIGTVRQVEIPAFITRIGDNAFANSDITDIYIPESVKFIGARAFTWCEDLKEVEIPQGVELIDDLAFANCSSLQKINLPDSLKFIGESAFHACSSLEKVVIPNGITAVSRRAFDFCTALTDVILPESVTVLHDGAFSHCDNLKSVHFSSGLTKISGWAFAECASLSDFDFPETLEEIGDVAFMNCRSLRRVVLPESVKRIGRQCFVNCTGLILILLPEHLRDQVKPQKAFQGVSGAEVEYV